MKAIYKTPLVTIHTVRYNSCIMDNISVEIDEEQEEDGNADSKYRPEGIWEEF